MTSARDHDGTAGVRPASTSDLPAVSLALAKAFADDPVKCFLIGKPHVEVDKSLPFFQAFGRMQHAHGHVYLTSGGEAAAVWAPPGHWKVPFAQIVKNTPTFLRLYGLRLVPNLGVLQTMEKHHPTAPHYYLEFIGTDPAHQGKGLGSALIRPMVERADEEGVGMYLESSKESNVAFYSRFGFQVTRTLQHRGKNAPTMWLMWRDPR